MKKKALISGLIFLLIAVIICFAVFFGNNTSNIEELFNKTVTTLNSDNSEELKNLFLENAKKYSIDLDGNIDEVNEFYKGRTISPKQIENLTVFHETDNIFTAYAIVKTDANKAYFVCIKATGARLVDEKGISQLIVEDYNTFKGKNIFKKHILKDYQKQARTYGITVRTPGDHNAYNKENKAIEELEKAN